MANGIDQEIQRKVDAYRGNPQQLMQRYQQNQQLVDLLALQKLKSEKEAAAREMQMQMAQQPQTIKQQREAELLNMTKQEMVQQTQGVLQQRQAQQQKNMQQVAQQGLGALANQRPATPQPTPQGQPMPQMARGGIVAFAPGGAISGDVSPEDIRAFRENLRRNNPRAAAVMSDARIAEIIRNMGQPAGTGVPDDVLAGYSALGRQMAGIQEPAVDTAAPIDRLVDQNRGDTPRGAMSTSAALANRPSAGIAALTGTQPEPQMSTPEGGLPTIPAQPQAAPTQPSTPDPAAAARNAVANMGGLGGGGAESAMEQGFARADAYTRRDENAARYADMEARLQQFDQERYDPRQEKRDQLISFLINARGTTAGSTMAAGAAASLRTRDRQNAEARQRLQDQFKMAQDGMQLDMSAAELGMQLGREMYAQSMQNQRTVYSAMANMRLEEVRALREEAQREFDRMKEDRRYEVDMMKEARESARLALDTRNIDADNARAAYQTILDTREALVETAVNNDQDLTRLELEASAALDDGDQERAAQLQAQADARYAMHVARANMVMEVADADDPNARSLLDYESDLVRAIGVGAGLPGPETLKETAGIVSPEDIVAVQ